MTKVEKKIKKILEDRTVLVTGSDGFVGSHLTELLVEYGADVHALARPHETIACVMTSTLNILQSIVDLDMDIYKLDTAGSSEEYGNIKKEVRGHYRFDRDRGLILDERSPINPQSVYAIAKVAADFLTRDFFNAYGVPGLVTRMFNNYGPRQNPRFITGTIITQALSKEVPK